MGQWIQKASMPTPRHDLQAITVGNQIYAISGGGDLTSEVVEIYDVETDTWSQGPPIPTKRGWFGAVLLNQKIYTIAGKTIRSDEEKARTGDPANYDIRDSVEVLDLASQTWASLKPIAAPRAGLAATLCNEKIYAIGGNAMNNEVRTGGPPPQYSGNIRPTARSLVAGNPHTHAAPRTRRCYRGRQDLRHGRNWGL